VFLIVFMVDEEQQNVCDAAMAITGQVLIGQMNAGIGGRGSPSTHQLPVPQALLVLACLIIIFFVSAVPNGFCINVSAADIKESIATADTFAKRRLEKRLRSNDKSVAEASPTTEKINQPFRSPPDRATSTNHDWHMYSLINDMKPLLPETADADHSLLAHSDPKVAADFVMNTIGFSVRRRILCCIFHFLSLISHSTFFRLAYPNKEHTYCSLFNR